MAPRASSPKASGRRVSDAGRTHIPGCHIVTCSAISAAACRPDDSASPETWSSIFGAGTDSSSGGDQLRSRRLPRTVGRPDSEKKPPLHAPDTPLGRAGDPQGPEPRWPHPVPSRVVQPLGSRPPRLDGEERSLGSSPVLNSEESVFIYHTDTYSCT